MKNIILCTYITFIYLLSFATQADDHAPAKIKTHSVAGNVYMLEGDGGNIGVLATSEGLLLVDNKFKPLAKEIEQSMKKIVDKPLKYIINTHLHGDHTGGNSYFGDHAPIFAHNNVRKRLSSKTDHDHASLPVVTYENGITIHLSDEAIKLTHYPHGHTDGDTVVHFEKANVLHMGDLFFQGRFPFIDLNNGGSVKGYLKNVLAIIKNYPNNIIIIPGHGDLTNMEGLKEFAEMLKFSINLVETKILNGLTEDEVIKQGIGEKYKNLHWNFITEKKWLTTLYTDLK